MRMIAMLILCAVLAGCATTEHPGNQTTPDTQPPYLPPTTWTMPAPMSGSTNVYHISIYCNEVRL